MFNSVEDRDYESINDLSVVEMLKDWWRAKIERFNHNYFKELMVWFLDKATINISVSDPSIDFK